MLPHPQFNSIGNLIKVTAIEKRERKKKTVKILLAIRAGNIIKICECGSGYSKHFNLCTNFNFSICTLSDCAYAPFHSSTGKFPIWNKNFCPRNSAQSTTRPNKVILPNKRCATATSIAKKGLPVCLNDTS